ncbi:putative internal virion protein [Rhizobium phage RHEph21]|uniref:Internal virion protein n=1 Tax=Rhizobium phage RHEph21 TaxID=2836134 RepID=A0AAE8AY25_9CAUD|nr:putative internal virion protein [Rhizobium phage RHEph21]
MLAVRPSTSKDVTYLAPRLRYDDLRELLAAGSASAEAALSDGLEHSRQCLTIHDEQDNAVAMFGVVPAGDPVGYVWLLGSDQIQFNKTQFLRHSRIELEKLQHEFPLLTNCVDARNMVHIAWLRWLGFKFLRQVTPGHLPFYEFARISNV